MYDYYAIIANYLQLLINRSHLHNRNQLPIHHQPLQQHHQIRHLHQSSQKISQTPFSLQPQHVDICTKLCTHILCVS